MWRRITKLDSRSSTSHESDIRRSHIADDPRALLVGRNPIALFDNGATTTRQRRVDIRHLEAHTEHQRASLPTELHELATAMPHHRPTPLRLDKDFRQPTSRPNRLFCATASKYFTLPHMLETPEGTCRLVGWCQTRSTLYRAPLPLCPPSGKPTPTTKVNFGFLQAARLEAGTSRFWIQHDFEPRGSPARGSGGPASDPP